MALPILLKHLRSASGADIELPIRDAAAALELFQRMLDVMVSPRGAGE